MLNMKYILLHIGQGFRAGDGAARSRGIWLELRSRHFSPAPAPILKLFLLENKIK